MSARSPDPEEFGVELSDYIALGDWRLFFVDREQVKNVTPAQIDAAAAKYFVRDNRVVGLFVPDDHPKRAEIAQAPSAEELISRFTFKETGAEVEAFDSSQDNIDKRTQIIEVGGVKTALLPNRRAATRWLSRCASMWATIRSLPAAPSRCCRGRCSCAVRRR